MTPLARLRDILGKLLLVSISIAIPLLCAEAYVRFHEDGMLFFPPYTHPRYMFVPDKDMQYDLAVNFPRTITRFRGGKYAVWTNSLGCFDYPYKGEKEYILLTGDSFAWGFAPLEEKASTLLEKSLHTRVVRAGVLGFGTHQELLKMRKVVNAIGHPPRAVVLMYYIDNDFTDDYLFPRYSVAGGYWVCKNFLTDNETWQKRTESDATLAEGIRNFDKYGSTKPAPSGILAKARYYLSSRSLLYQRMVKSPLMYKVADALHIPNHGYKPEPVFTLPTISKIRSLPDLSAAWDKHLENLDAFKAQADTYGAHLLVVLIPHKDEVARPIPEEQLSQALQAHLREKGIPYIDMLPLLREHVKTHKHVYYALDPHWDVEGERFAARVIEKALQNYGF